MPKVGVLVCERIGGQQGWYRAGHNSLSSLDSRGGRLFLLPLKLWKHSRCLMSGSTKIEHIEQNARNRSSRTGKPAKRDGAGSPEGGRPGCVQRAAGRCDAVGLWFELAWERTGGNGMRSSRTTSIRLAAVIRPRAGSDPRQQGSAVTRIAVAAARSGQLEWYHGCRRRVVSYKETARFFVANIRGGRRT